MYVDSVDKEHVVSHSQPSS